MIAAVRQGISKDTEITAICDGANDCWSVVDYLRPYCKNILSILDWFYLVIKFKNTAVQMSATGDIVKRGNSTFVLRIRAAIHSNEWDIHR